MRRVTTVCLVVLSCTGCIPDVEQSTVAASSSSASSASSASSSSSSGGGLACENGALDPGEADADCGGSCERRCDPGSTCRASTDCVLEACESGRCSSRVTAEWVKIDTSATGTPSARDAHGLVALPGGDLLLVGGGDGFVPTLATDVVWRWDGQAWSPVVTANDPPPEFSRPLSERPAGAAYILESGDTLLFDDATSTWTTAGFSGVTKPERRNAAIALDPSTGASILFGGGDTSGYDDTWKLTAQGWTKLFPVHFPTPNMEGGMAFDAAHSEWVFFGGRNTDPSFGFDATWIFDGTDWKNATQPTLNNIIFFHQMA
jgi:hypothetical protein